MKWSTRMLNMIRARFSKGKQDEIAKIEADVLAARISEGVSQDRFRSVLNIHRRKYHPSGLSRSLNWKQDE